jgi:hypothetical protein
MAVRSKSTPRPPHYTLPLQSFLLFVGEPC